jgi:hypothetical protein
MTALAADRTTKTRSGERMTLPVAGSTKIFAGSMVGLGSDGYARPGRATSTDQIVGIAEQQVDNSGGDDGDLNVEVLRRVTGCFGNSSSGDAVTLTERGKTVFAVDDQTVAKTNSSGARPAAGKVIDVTSEGVWVEFGSPVVDFVVAALAAGLKVAYGQKTTASAADTVDTGLALVLGAVANLEDAPVIGCDRAQAVYGDQAGTPAAGSIIIKTFKPTASGDATPVAATTTGKKVNWIAVGK